jgi:hypothetical protein
MAHFQQIPAYSVKDNVAVACRRLARRSEISNVEPSSVAIDRGERN